MYSNRCMNNGYYQFLEINYIFLYPWYEHLPVSFITQFTTSYWNTTVYFLQIALRFFPLDEELKNVRWDSGELKGTFFIKGLTTKKVGNERRVHNVVAKKNMTNIELYKLTDIVCGWTLFLYYQNCNTISHLSPMTLRVDMGYDTEFTMYCK